MTGVQTCALPISPGEISIVYYDFKFNNFDSNKDVLLIDQPEDDISNNKISEDLLKRLNILILLIMHPVVFL